MSPPTTGRIPELDGIRGLAILFVLGFHLQAFTGGDGWLNQIFRFGWCGVDLFFALSGFLITGVLLDLATSDRRIQTFYARRSLRIWPLYYGALVIYFGWAALSGKPTPFAEQALYWLHLSNWQSAFRPLQFPSLSVFWTLAIEEQFYLVWPLVVWNLPHRALLRTCVAGAVVCGILRNLPAAQALAAVYPNYLYRLTPFHLDGIFLGSLCALIYRAPDMRLLAKRYVGAIALVSGAVFVVIEWLSRDHAQLMSRVGNSVLAVAAASLVLFGALRSPRILRAPVLRSFGKYSYCIYVIHTAVYAHALWPIEKLLGGGTAAALAAGLICIGGMYLVAIASWNGFEKRFIALAQK